MVGRGEAQGDASLSYLALGPGAPHPPLGHPMKQAGGISMETGLDPLGQGAVGQVDGMGLRVVRARIAGW